MPVTRKDVEYIAELARLQFSEEEKEVLIEDLNKVLSYMKKLDELNTEDVDVIVNPYYIENRFREDEVEVPMKLEDVMMNVPQKLEEYVVVPKIIE